MAVLKCKMCGGSLDVTEGMTVCECEYCGTVQTIPQIDDEKKITLFTRANRLRAACEFDKAAGVYENIVSDFPEEAEAYWGLVLCKFGIEYVDDPATGKKIPTCHRSSFESIMDDPDFEQTMENADPIARKVYREEAKTIDGIQKGILEISGKEEPYDIFICYKETDDNGERTVDSVMAQDIYDMLTANKYRVFFARVTLEDKLGTAYEPYIFAALNSARIMLAVGTDYEYYNAVWVKNEWSRFLAMMSKDKKKVLIPCYKDIDAYDIPKEFKHLQAQDMGKVGAMQDLLRGIKKILPKETAPVVQQVTQVVQQVQPASGGANVNSLLQRVFMFLEDGDWKNADQYCERILDIDPQNAQAYLGKLMAELKVKKKDNLKDCAQPFDGKDNYKKIIRFGDNILKNEINEYLKFITDRNNQKHSEEVYQKAQSIYKGKTYNINELMTAATLFSSISEYKDSSKMVDICNKQVEFIQKRNRLSSAKNSFDYDLIDNEVIITKYLGSNESVVIPMVIDNHLVTKIGNGAFRFNSNIKSVDIPDSVTVIERFAFDSCDNLSQVVFSENLRIIEKNAFNSTKLIKLELPEKLEIIEADAFAYCKKLVSVYLPNSLTKIGESCFNECVSLQTVENLGNIPCIESYQFGNCRSLTNIILPETIKKIDYWAFSGCKSLQSINIPDSVEKIAPNAFKGCKELRTITGKISVFYKSQEKCQYCGGDFAGMFKKKCTNCGHEKDYSNFWD